PMNFGYVLRERWLAPLDRIWRFTLGPALSALLIVYVAAAFGSHALFNIFDDAGFTCEASKTTRDVPEEGALFDFRASDLCRATGLRLLAQNKYLIWINPDPVKLATHVGYETLPSVCKPDDTASLRNGSVTTTPAGY